MHDDLEHRATVHAALGDATRLGIVEDLQSSDRSPNELAERWHLPSNLLAHHLDVLERAGLVDRIVSEGDRRRRYITLRRDRLDGLIAPVTPPAACVLFVCTHNSARSQLAAALWHGRTGLPATSAGTHPADRVHPRAVAAARRAGLDIAAATPCSLDETRAVETVITVCDRAHEALDPDDSWWHWSIPDPVESGRAAEFDAVVANLNERLDSFTLFRTQPSR